MKHTNVTKIDVKNIDEDLCPTRQITITNCNKYVFNTFILNFKQMIIVLM